MSRAGHGAPAALRAALRARAAVGAVLEVGRVRSSRPSTALPGLRASLRRDGAAARAVALEEDVPAHELVPEPLRRRELDAVLADRVHIAELATSQAYQVVVRLLDVGVVAGRAGTGVHLLHLAHGDELVERVVDGRQAHLGQPASRDPQDLVRGE